MAIIPVPCGFCQGTGEHLVADVILVRGYQTERLASGGVRYVTCGFCAGTGDASPQAIDERRRASYARPQLFSR